jgi:prolipoprotein diacylglyceryltransferase
VQFGLQREAGVILHSVFDGLALLAAVSLYVLQPKFGADPKPRWPWSVHPFYLPSMSFGAIAGAYLFGSLNLWLTGMPAIARSIEGAIAGAIFGVEMLKLAAGIRGSTGARYAAPLAAAIAIGRIGCFSAGLDDMTYGTPTSLPWGWDFGDGVKRHPVQLYESAAMLAFLVVFLLPASRRHVLVAQAGFYLFVGAYAAQRFLWEFLKPYGTVVGPFNLFHLLSAALIVYAILFARREMMRSWTTHDTPAPIRA